MGELPTAISMKEWLLALTAQLSPGLFFSSSLLYIVNSSECIIRRKHMFLFCNDGSPLYLVVTFVNAQQKAF